MAQGDVVVFAKAKERMGDGQFSDLSTAVVHVALTTGVTAPVETATDPRWAAGGSPDYSAEEVAAGGTYSTGGAAVDGADTWTLSGATCTFDLDDKTWTKNASNPTNATECIGYVNDANDYALFYLDIGGAFDMRTGDLIITWDVSGVFTLA